MTKAGRRSKQGAWSLGEARRGYTLMEVMIALVILASSLTILMGTQSGSVQQGSRANMLTKGTMLARAKMLDIESQLAADGFNADTETERGTFRDEGFPTYSWEYEVELVEIDEGASESLLSETNSKLFGEGEDGSGGAFTGNAAFAAYLPMVVGMVPDMINRLGEKVRRVTLTVTWEFRGAPETPLVLVQYVTDLKADEREQNVPGAGGLLGPGGAP
ncbi:MAG: type II secretion system protein [Myxococcota bacterium]